MSLEHSPIQAGLAGRLLACDRDVAELLGLSKATVWRHTAAGVIPAPIKIGGRTLWLVDELTEFVRTTAADQRGGGDASPGRSTDQDTKT